MFNKRADGKFVKGLDGVTKLGAVIMRSKEGSANYARVQIKTKTLDEFIAKRREEGIEYNYRDIVMGAIARIYTLFPKYNRFIIAGKFFQRNYIDLAMMAHKDLRSGDDETAVKTRLTGYETLGEIKEKFTARLKVALEALNGTDTTSDFLAKLPYWAMRGVVNIMRLADRWGLLSDKFMFEVSPFHCSAFLSDLKSLGLDALYHHVYNFGNCGAFFTMGKEKLVPYVNQQTGEITAEKIIELGVTLDDRVCDGLYNSRVLRTLKRILDNPACLEERVNEKDIHKIKTYKEIKAEKKAAKLKKKLKKKKA
ncbi:MAG: 2-oxo acid dehydrogenase subunit E2 [Christensenellaceae bacterium]|jgi:hypothetical protein|nr:2-oxo acid dehydrogenase subunit E2 [Christensenellaceae bacterium]